MLQAKQWFTHSSDKMNDIQQEELFRAIAWFTDAVCHQIDLWALPLQNWLLQLDIQITIYDLKRALRTAIANELMKEYGTVIITTK